jgi:hypothetical protein
MGSMAFTVEDLQDLLRLLEQQPAWKEAVRAALWGKAELTAWLREQLPKLLQEDPLFGAQVVGVLQQTLSPRSELVRVLEEIRALREDFARRFEAVDRRFEAMDERFRALQEEMDRRFEAVERRFEAMDERFRALQEEMDRRFQAMEERFRALQEEMDRRFQAMDERFRALQLEMARRFEAVDRRFEQQARILRRMEVGMGSLGLRFGKGFEEAVRATVEEFAGIGPLQAERLVLRDTAGELYGVPNQQVEFDAYVHDSRRFLVEVKAFAEREDVLNFSRKVEFARRHLPDPFEAVLLAPYATQEAVQLARELGVRLLMQPEEGMDESSPA